MNVYPDMDIRYPEHAESSLGEGMAAKATGRWQQCGSPVGRPIEDGEYFFHRDSDGSIAGCIVCIGRKAPGHSVVRNVVADAGSDGLSIDQYVAVLHEFNTTIAEPAAEAIDGMTSIDTSKRSLDDYFSKEAIALLEHFCKDSNQGDLGTHSADQRKWMAFLLHVHRNEKEDVHCDTFGALLKANAWWPGSGIARLVSQYDFALRLLQQADKE